MNVEITMFTTRAELEAEMNRIEIQERLRGRTLTAEEITNPSQDITEPIK